MDGGTKLLFGTKHFAVAQLLCRKMEVNHPIPDKSYAAVAEVLAYVYQLKGKKLPSTARVV
jgi:flagellar biosynthetic protein FlhB